MQQMQHPGSRGAYALYRAQLFLAGFQHRRKIPEPVDQVVGDTVGVLLGVGQVKHIFQRLVLGQTVQPIVLHPLPHPLAMSLVPFILCHGGTPFSMFSPYSTHFAVQTQAFCKNNPDFAPECALTSRPACITIKA